MNRSIVVLALLLTACGGTDPEGIRPGDCLNGLDDDENGAIDCDDAGCAGSPDCEAHAAQTVGDPTDTGGMGGSSGGSGNGQGSTGSSDGDAPPDGNALFELYCSGCHGQAGVGGSGGALEERVLRYTDTELRSIILNGSGRMGAVAVWPDEADAIVNHLRDLFPG